MQTFIIRNPGLKKIKGVLSFEVSQNSIFFGKNYDLKYLTCIGVVLNDGLTKRGFIILKI